MPRSQTRSALCSGRWGLLGAEAASGIAGMKREMCEANFMGAR
ncbi:hypothetical protein HRbin30_02047 [bacterium HR30]|nr:hypothetical protein HRbin30_02047 [bacterium HR30]